MRYRHNGERIEVAGDEASGLSLTAPPDEIPLIQAELQEREISSVREHEGVRLDGQLVEELLHINHRDRGFVQRVLDDAEFGSVNAQLGLQMIVRVRRRPWSIIIRRLNSNHDLRFKELDGQHVCEEDIRDFVGNPQQLQWTTEAAGSDDRTESYADRPPYRVILRFPSNLDPMEVQAQFVEALNQGQ